MKKLNNKGMTIVEILVTFAIAATITVSMYVSINNLKNRKTIATYQNGAKQYKDTIVNKVQDDIIFKHLQSVSHNEARKEITFTFKGGETKVMKIIQTNKSILEDPKPCNTSDSVSNDFIKYGDDVYELPNFNLTPLIDNSTGKCVMVNNFSIEKYEYDVISNVLYLKIYLFHPDLGDKFSINIVAPIGE